MIILRPCPFCGGKAVQSRIGNGRQSSIVECEDCGATVEANETGEANGSRWNGSGHGHYMALALEWAAKSAQVQSDKFHGSSKVTLSAWPTRYGACSHDRLPPLRP